MSPINPVTIAAGSAVLGGMMSYKGNMSAAKSATQVGEYNAKVAENEKVLTQRATRENERILTVNSERIAATQRVMTAASGIQMSGSPLQALFDTYLNTEVDATKIRYAGSVEEANKESEASLARLQAGAQATAFKYNALTGAAEGGVRAATILS